MHWQRFLSDPGCSSRRCPISFTTCFAVSSSNILLRNLSSHSVSLAPPTSRFPSGQITMKGNASPGPDPLLVAAIKDPPTGSGPQTGWIGLTVGDRTCYLHLIKERKSDVYITSTSAAPFFTIQSGSSTQDSRSPNYHGVTLSVRDASPPVNNAASWMSDNLPLLGGRKLRNICMPGSHDAGMYCLNEPRFLGTERNTQTQTVSIQKQLELGARYFDLRPACQDGGPIFAGHFSEAAGVTLGACGASFTDIVSQINAFCETHNELVILHLSHFRKFHVGGDAHFNSDDFHRLFSQLKGINALYVASSIDSWGLYDSLTLKDFICPATGARAAVIVLVDTDEPEVVIPADAGFYDFKPLSTRFFDQYSNKADWKVMAADQLAKLQAPMKPPVFLLSWTCTQTPDQAMIPSAPSILELAEPANSQLLYQLLPCCSATRYPSIIHTDAIASDAVAQLAMQVNHLAAASP